MEERSGGLMLCECGHCKAYHFRRAKWFGGPLTENAPCAHCGECEEYAEGKDQGYKMAQDPHAKG